MSEENKVKPKAQGAKAAPVNEVKAKAKAGKVKAVKPKAAVIAEPVSVVAEPVAVLAETTATVAELPAPKGDKKDGKPKKDKKDKKKAKKKEKRKKEAVIIRFEDAQLPQIDAKAETLGLSRAAWVRMVVAQALAKG